MSAVVIESKIVHYEVLGRGPGILLIHGWLGSWRYWVPTMQALSARYRTYALDLWGFGDTSRAPDHYSLDDHVELLYCLLEHLGVARVAVVGHAFGGAVALQFALKYPEYVARVMAIGAPLSAAAVSPRFSENSISGLVDWLLSKVPGSEEVSREAEKTDPPVLGHTLQSLNAIDLRTRLGDLNVPCLLVHGEKDPVVSVPHDSWLTELKNSNTLHRLTFEECSHFPMLEEPPKFHRLLLDFLEAGDDLASLTLKDEWKRRMR